MVTSRASQFRRAGGRLAAAAVVSLLALTACGDDSGGGGGSNDEIVTLLQGEGETPASAECIADALADYSVDDITAFVDGDGADEALAADVAAAVETCAESLGE